MGKTQVQIASNSDPIWVGGFTIDHFLLPPSAKTEVATAAAVMTNVLLDIETVDTSMSEMVTGDTEGVSFDVFNQVLQDWGNPQDEGADLAERRPEWSVLAGQSIQPSSKPEQRILDNIEAIKLLREIEATQRPVTAEDRATLLRYCGWGGLARVFTPDGSSPHKWSLHRDELQMLTSESEFEQMQASITTSYYTDLAIVQACWAIASKLGFTGGRVLEPSAGVGHFLAGMPSDIAKKSDITAVELDGVSAAMLEKNFGSLGVQVHPGALEKARLPVAFYDLVIGNVPFGDFRSLDTSKADYADWSIHNYFLGKSVDVVRPGGLIILITSRHTMDSLKDSHRRWLAAHAELLGAYRLPTMAFKSQANTEAVTDILVLRRRETPDYQAGGWTKLVQATSNMLKPGQSASTYVNGYRVVREPVVNDYYVRHPEHVFGLLTWESSQHGEVLNPVYDGDMPSLLAALTEQIEKLPEGAYTPARELEGYAPRTAMTRHENAHFISPGSFVVRDQKICVSEGDELLEVDAMYTGTARKRMLGMIDIRNRAIRVIEHQAQSPDDDELQRLQGELNVAYDKFVADMGYLSTRANSSLMRTDPEWPIMLALEVWDEEEGKAAKADIFTRRTVGHRKYPDKVDNVKDAMLVSLSLYGKIVLKDMALRTGMPVAQVVNEMKAQAIAYRDPVLARWVPADEYLSGHIRDKIAAARAAGPAYADNIEALEAVLPADLAPSEVEARLGAPWIPADVIEQFAIELVEAEAGKVEVKYASGTATWSVKSTTWRLEWVGNSTLQRIKWGTNKRCALELLEGALNQQPPTITMEIDGKRVTDRVETIKNREKWQAIRDEFRKWVYSDEARRDRLLRLYNDQFNQVVVRKFDGSHLKLEGMSLAVTPYPHQLDAIWRIVVNGNTLLAHCVGAGKTLVMVAASMELRRLGKSVKPLHVVPNHCLEQYVAEFVRLYPQAKVLMASKDDLHGDKRRTFVARVAAGDFDAVVMTQATFERLMLSPNTQRDFIEDMVREARLSAKQAEDNGAKRSLKEVEKKLRDLEAKVERLANGSGKDADSVWFEELGVDYFFIDEAHAYKNMPRLSKMPRVAGLPNTASNRAFDVFMKTRVLMAQRGGAEEGVVFATATPITNSIAELHTMQAFLQPQTLKKFGLYEFDAWSASYGESVTGIELAPDGSGYRLNTRYSRFTNLPELMAIFRGVADIRTKRMLNLPTPRIVGGKPQVVVSEPSNELKAIVEDLVKRAAGHKTANSPENDNMLLITGDGRKAALDVRMIDPTLPADPKGKLAEAADNMYRIWDQGHDLKTTQLMFCDIGTPGGKGFNVYAEVKRLLMEKGVPPEEIEFMQDHNSDSAKAKLFKKVREGLVRFLFGSTKMMGTGTNVQPRLKAVHQLDGPWVPSDVEQRDGRAERQGNLNAEIELLRYITQGSFDAYTWQLLNIKVNFIEQVMTAETGLRSVEDISMSALTYAEIKAIASGNPLVMEKATIDAKVQKLGLLRSEWEDDKWRLNQREANLVSRMAWIDKHMPLAEVEAKLAEDLGSKPVFVPADSVAQKAIDASDASAKGVAMAFRARSSQVMPGQVISLGAYGGFTVLATKSWGQSQVILVGPQSGVEIEVDRPNLFDLEGVAKAIHETAESFKDLPARYRSEYADKANELATTKKMLAAEFEHAQELEQLLQRQREIESALDLDKDVAGAAEMAAEST